MSTDNLIHKNFDDANLSGADLAGADLTGASLRRAKLTGAKLANAHLAESDLHGARLDHADVTGADLRDADLTGASLHGVDLDRAATTEGIRLAGAHGVTGHFADVDDDQAAQHHVLQATDDVQRLTRELIAVARQAALEPAVTAGADTRRQAAERIAELQRRRSLLEERLLSLLEDDR